MEKYKVLGLMSGTSLDGLDIAYMEFTRQTTWEFTIGAAETIAYPPVWEQRLRNVLQTDADKLVQLDRDYGRYLGECCNDFMERHKVQPELIGSHGHTVFHRPDLGYTLQVGHGAYICNLTGINTVSDFRSGDMALGGQGAPLVPVGDKLLFGAYDACLNLGGFANISLEREGRRIAWDITAVNIVLNELALQLGKPYDEGGSSARAGSVNTTLLRQLNALHYYRQLPPKSLGREWVEEEIFPLLKETGLTTEDLLHTCTLHIAAQLAETCMRHKISSVLVTGGGAYNSFLLEQVKSLCPDVQLIVPDDKIIQYKEALIFALLAVLRIRGEVNVLSSVTGASQDHCAGAMW